MEEEDEEEDKEEDEKEEEEKGPGCFFCRGRGDIAPRKFKMSHRKSHGQSSHND